MLVPSLTADHYFLLTESQSSLPSPRTQAQQMSDAMALKTLQGTKWRLLLDLPDNSKQPQQALTLVFQGFANQPNKGIVQLSTPNRNDIPPTTGRWLSKPSEIRRRTVQLSARWKLRVATIDQSYIFKGFIRAAPKLSAGGTTVEAEMVGSLLAVDTEETIGKFRADLIAIDIPEEELRM